MRLEPVIFIYLHNMLLSTQESNMYVNGGSEEEWMNRLADAMVPYLNASGIQFDRNTPDMNAVSSIRASNAGNYDLHLALHSNASAPSNYGRTRGIIVFYYPGSSNGTGGRDHGGKFESNLSPAQPGSYRGHHIYRGGAPTPRPIGIH